MSFTVQLAIPDDVPDMCNLTIKAFVSDQTTSLMQGNTTYEEKLAFWRGLFSVSMGRSRELGIFQAWKVVNEKGEIVGWSGLSLPNSLPDEDLHPAGVKILELPKEKRNDALIEYNAPVIMSLSSKNGYDPKKHCHRLGTAVHPDYQKQGLGTMLMHKCNAIADELGVETYARIQPSGFPLFIKQGFEVLEKWDWDLGEFGVEGKTSMYSMKRTPVAKAT